jgi:hypothetical protein
MTYTQKLQTIIDTLTASLSDAESFDNGNDSAGRRIRKLCQESKTSLQTFRQEIQAERLSRKASK